MTFRIIVNTLSRIKISFDPGKDARNRAKHAVSLALAADLAWDEALIWPDLRHDYGELRECALVPSGDRLFFVAFTERHEEEEGKRIISLRHARKREVERYVHYSENQIGPCPASAH